MILVSDRADWVEMTTNLQRRTREEGWKTIQKPDKQLLLKFSLRTKIRPHVLQ